jgi:hypothetical protein
MATKKGGAKKSASKKGGAKGASKKGVLPPPQSLQCILNCVKPYAVCIKSGTNARVCQKRLIACIHRCLGIPDPTPAGTD